MRRWALLFAVIGACAVAQPALADTLALQGLLPGPDATITCPPADAGPSTSCRLWQGAGVIPGLGSVSVSQLLVYVSFTDVNAQGTLTVADKGTVTFAGEGPGNRSSFTITGGTGVYAGASGSGVWTNTLAYTPGTKFDLLFTGSLTVPGLQFDTTPPTLSHVQARVAARRVTVSFAARDDSAGPLASVVQARVGSKTVKTTTGADHATLAISAKRGARVTVTVSVTDSSGNTRKRSIVVVAR